VKYQDKSPLNISILFKNEGQEDKTGPFQGWVPVGGGHKERVKDSEYGGRILYSCMKMEQ
jgi:hypothetical protein